MPSIVIVDYGMGNLRSVQGALRRLACEAIVSSDANILKCADGIVLPGVGAFGAAMKNLSPVSGLLTELVIGQGVPILGICLGMQLFAEYSEEYGTHQGFGWIKGAVTRIPVPSTLSLPHVGWNQVSATGVLQQRMLKNVPTLSNFYFDHSFAIQTDRLTGCEYATTDYGNPVLCALMSNNIWGAQFHPEKSQLNGLRVLNNFIAAVREKGERS